MSANQLHKPYINKEYVSDPIYSKFVVLDFETTGLSPRTDKIIEIGAVKVIKNAITDTFNTLINPHRPISGRISSITGITDNMVADSPNIEDMIPKLLQFIDGFPLVAHNAPFDIGFLEANCPETYDLIIADTLKLTRKLFPNLPNHRLGTICSELHIDVKGFHRALADSMATAEVYFKCQQAFEKAI